MASPTFGTSGSPLIDFDTDFSEADKAFLRNLQFSFLGYDVDHSLQVFDAKEFKSEALSCQDPTFSAIDNSTEQSPTGIDHHYLRADMSHCDPLPSIGVNSYMTSGDSVPPLTPAGHGDPSDWSPSELQSSIFVKLDETDQSQHSGDWCSFQDSNSSDPQSSIDVKPHGKHDSGRYYSQDLNPSDSQSSMDVENHKLKHGEHEGELYAFQACDPSDLLSIIGVDSSKMNFNECKKSVQMNYPEEEFYANQVTQNSYSFIAPGIDCSSCRVLREVVHSDSNGFVQMKLNIHGGLGRIGHALIETHYTLDGTFERDCINFSDNNFEGVCKFATKYGRLRASQGFNVIHDSLANFIDALYTPMKSDFAATSHLGLELNGTCQDKSPIVSHHKTGIVGPIFKTRKKSRMASQRERTKELQLSDLRALFHLPMDLAAKRLDLCTTSLKNLCRSNKIMSWPYRRIKTIYKNIMKLHRELHNEDGSLNNEVAFEIERLKADRAEIYTCSSLQTQRVTLGSRWQSHSGNAVEQY